MRKPNFFIVGEPKAGTTALFEMLSQHPEIFASPVKEPNHFNTDFHEKSDSFQGRPRFYTDYRDRSAYLSLFKNAGEHHKAIGEATTHYLFSTVAARDIASFNPEAKIIMMFREPVDFLYALHMELRYQFAETENDFLKALELEEERRRGRRIPKRVPFPELLFYSEWVKYADHAQRFIALFPQSQILIILYDDFKRDNISVVKKVFAFLGVDPSFTPIVKRVNVSREVRFPFLKKILEHPLIFTPFKKVLPREYYVRVRETVYTLLNKPMPRKPLSQHDILVLKKRFAPEVARADELLRPFIGKSLCETWEYPCA